MMMAHHSSPGPGALAEETIAELRSALIWYVHAPSKPEALRAAFRNVAVEARAKAILPEHLLVTLKDVWYSLPAVHSMGDPEEQVRLLQRVVTMCIKEYYAG